MVWNFAQGLITAVQGILAPQTVVAMTQRQNEIDRITSQFEMQNRSLEFQAAMEGVRQRHSKEIDEYRQYCEDVRLQKRLDSEREQLARRFQHEEKLEQYRRETHLILSRAQLLTALTLADDKEIRENFPLKTPARVILDAYKSYQENMKQIPLLVVISPPALQFEKFPHAAQGFDRIEDRLIDEIRDFCKHYPLTNQERPVRYQGADWKSKSFHGKTAIDTLHHVLKSVPTVVLESKVDGNSLNIFLAAWDMMQEVPYYEKVLTIPWKEVLYPIAQKYAREWRNLRMILLDKKTSMEEIKSSGGDDEINLLILEQEEAERGLRKEHDYKYHVNEDKCVRELAQSLGICHCILVGLMADRYHFYHGDVRPKLPELLPGLLEKMPSDSLKEMLVGEIVSSYQSLYQSIEGERPNAIPYLFLDLALSLSGLSDKSWAKKQVESSIKAWLKLRGIKQTDRTNLLESMKPVLVVKDKVYVEKIQKIFSLLRDSQTLTQTEILLSLISDIHHSDINILKSILKSFYRRIPVTIITGLLGSGKTTLINQIIKNTQNLKAAVLIGGKGKIEVDRQYITYFSLLKDFKYGSSGCPICDGKDEDRINDVYKVLDRQPKIDHLVVELSELEDPLPTALTFLEIELRHLIYLNSIITVIDPANSSLDLFSSQAVYVQIVYADVILLNKVDLFDELALDELEARIREIKPDARILRCVQGQVPLPLISDLGLDHLQVNSPYLKNGSISLVSFQSDRAFVLRKFQYFIDNQILSSVFRAKGIMWFEESPKRHHFSLSGKRFSIDDDDWDSQPKNQLVLIGQNLDAEWLKARLQDCLS